VWTAAIATSAIKKPDSGRKLPGITRAPSGGMDKDELQQRSLKFAVAVTGLTRVMRDSPNSRGPADQLSRCAASVGANYRAACRARSRAEFIAKLGLVVEEIDETVYWLELVTLGGLTAPASAQDLLDEAHQLRAIFAASYGTARKNYQLARRHRRRNPAPNR
jgi:four helix bundle protein